MAIMGHWCTSIDHMETISVLLSTKKRHAHYFRLCMYIINFDQNQINVISLRRFHGQLKPTVFQSLLRFVERDTRQFVANYINIKVFRVSYRFIILFMQIYAG